MSEPAEIQAVKKALSHRFVQDAIILKLFLYAQHHYSLWKQAVHEMNRPKLTFDEAQKQQERIYKICTMKMDISDLMQKDEDKLANQILEAHQAYEQALAESGILEPFVIRFCEDMDEIKINEEFLHLRMMTMQCMIALDGITKYCAGLIDKKELADHFRDVQITNGKMKLLRGIDTSNIRRCCRKYIEMIEGYFNEALPKREDGKRWTLAEIQVGIEPARKEE